MNSQNKRAIPDIKMPFIPVWDVYQEMKRLSDLTRLLAYLTSQQQDSQVSLFSEAFSDLSERIGAARDELGKTLTQPDIVDPH